MISFWRHPILYIRRILLPTCKTCINHYDVHGYCGTGFCDCKEYRDRYEKLEGDELERDVLLRDSRHPVLQVRGTLLTT